MFTDSSHFGLQNVAIKSGQCENIVTWGASGILWPKKRILFLVCVCITQYLLRQPFLFCCWSNHFLRSVYSGCGTLQWLLLVTAYCVFCFRWHDLLRFVVYHSNMIKSQKYLSTVMVCSWIKKKNPPKKFASLHHFFHINGQETKVNFFLAYCSESEGHCTLPQTLHCYWDDAAHCSSNFALILRWCCPL